MGNQFQQKFKFDTVRIYYKPKPVQKCSKHLISKFSENRPSTKLAGLGLLELWHLIYPKLLIRFGMLVVFTNVSLMEFQVRYMTLFLLFSVIDGFGWFWMGILHKNIQLILEFFKGLWSSYTFPTIH